MNIGAVAVSVSRTLDEGPSDIGGIVSAIRQLREAGAELPSEREMALQLNVKRHQLRKALEQLRKAGD
ncbi:MAG: GntR family transcriptional regulator, partial [Aestuariivirga sp.]|uniref:GntR family transcriptional regulator n=1 Tax=Aestuariivirga sp. TaxID=2650926 RepID=UPI0030182B39